ncbi:MAG: 50S ribosomal protein L24 [Candidatus Gracilibacteria bacterium]|jgi:large subunit ribosomal protein L24|nr:50S ribosomal protein L24 [Candidatus Gracilibacteria bacterium]
MKLQTNDTVQIITGKDKGKKGKVIKAFPKTERIVVEKVNIRTKHIKKSQGRSGEIVKYEADIDASNAMLVCPNCSKPTRTGYNIDKDGKKNRVCKKCKEIIVNKKN